MAGPSETLIGRRVSAVAFAIYAAQGAETRPWLVPDDTLAGTVAGRWVRAHVDPSEIAARADSLLTLRDLAIAGAGRTILPCYLGDVVPERLVRLGEPLPDAVSELWLLMHADLSRTARVRASWQAPWRENGICSRGVAIGLLAVGSVNATDISGW